MSKIYFISGHRDITNKEFNEHYLPMILNIAYREENPKFVLGDYEGADFLAQEILHYLCLINVLNKRNITVYHMFDIAMNNVGNFKTIGGFKTDVERDSAMTAISDEDIAWIRECKIGSGTHQNIERRNLS